MDSTLVLHAGTHKTGTTSLQKALASNRHVLHSLGVHYPTTRTLAMVGPDATHGHHNVAWELNDDPRFDAGAGTLAQLLDEIAADRSRLAVASSEDFEYLHRRPDALHALAAAIASIGYTPSVVLYLRSQPAYAQSLYAELACHYGLKRDFDSYLADIAAEGRFTFRGWTFAFDYEPLIATFEAAFGTNALSLRAFERGPEPGWLYRSFIAPLLPRESDFLLLDLPAMLNESRSFEFVLEGLRRNVGRGGTVDPAAALPNDRFDVLDEGEAAAFSSVFRASNDRLAARFGVRVPEPLLGAPALDEERRRARLALLRDFCRENALERSEGYADGDPKIRLSHDHELE